MPDTSVCFFIVVESINFRKVVIGKVRWVCRADPSVGPVWFIDAGGTRLDFIHHTWTPTTHLATTKCKKNLTELIASF